MDKLNLTVCTYGDLLICGGGFYQGMVAVMQLWQIFTVANALLSVGFCRAHVLVGQGQVEKFHLAVERSLVYPEFTCCCGTVEVVSL